MSKFAAVLASLLAFLAASATVAAAPWVDGQHYQTLRSPVAQGSDGIVITEVFSYGCPACNMFLSTMHRIHEAMPAGTRFVYVPASFIPTEDWPMFQRAYYAAQALDIAEKTHTAMFNAVWGTGELATMDPVTHALKPRMPTIEDAARFYHRVGGVKAEDFLAAANSFSVDSKMRAADDLVEKYRVTSTPTIVVNGRYTTTPQAAGGYDELVSLVTWLATKDGAATHPADKHR